MPCWGPPCRDERNKKAHNNDVNLLLALGNPFSLGHAFDCLLKYGEPATYTQHARRRTKDTAASERLVLMPTCCAKGVEMNQASQIQACKAKSWHGRILQYLS